MNDDTTFSDLGIPFPLFEAPTRLAPDYIGKSRCDMCAVEGGHAFRTGRGDTTVCYDCLRAGRAAFTQDTEFGMVRLEDAEQGLTHGVPGLSLSGYDTILNEEGWRQVKVPSALLLELVRTPSYLSWQGVRWLFCCGGPMTYVGEWKEADFSRHAKDGDGQALFSELCAGEEWASLTWDTLTQEFSGVIYAFHCKKCSINRVQWDCD